MTTRRTLAIIKPDAMEALRAGDIIQDILNAGFRIAGIRTLHLSRQRAETFYAVHREKPFFSELTAFISRSPIMVLALEKENAVADFRTLIGATNPEQAAEGTIRKKYARSLEENAIHGSDSNENAQNEIHCFFSEHELL